MSRRTKNYSFVYLESGDTWYPGFDMQNMQTVENQYSYLYEFIGTGVIDGWDVTSMSINSPQTDTSIAVDNTLINQIKSERQLLRDAAVGTDLYLQYLALGSPAINDDAAWSQVVRVTPGTGIINVYHAETRSPAYFLITAEGQFDIWAEASLCLTSEGLAVISMRSTVDDDGSNSTSAYLAQIEAIYDSEIGLTIGRIRYTDNRQMLKNLEGAVQKALKLVFYGHVHAGAPNHPSKIELSSQLILDAPIPKDYPGTTIFLIKNESGNTFTWNDSQYGVPEILLNNKVLPNNSYRLEPSSGKIYLKNSLPEGSTLQVILPLSVTIKLTPIDIAQPKILLTQNAGTQVQFSTRNPSLYDIPQVYLNGILQPQYDIDGNKIYDLAPNYSYIYFTTPLSSEENVDLYVVLTLLGKQITGILPGGRLKDVKAESFVKGTLSSTRFGGLDHVGQMRFKEKASLRPHLRLLDRGDYKTYYPELVNNPIQYNTMIKFVFRSVNIGTVVATKRGLFTTQDYITFSDIASWNADMGNPIAMSDNLFNYSDNHFKETYVLTEEGIIYRTRDNATSWQIVPLPRITGANGVVIKPKVTSFCVRTDMVEVETNVLVKEVYYTQYYMGTENHGMFSAYFKEGTVDKDWIWTRYALPVINDGTAYTIYSITELTTKHTVTTTDDNGNSSTETSYEHSLYIGAGDETDSSGGYFAAINGGGCAKINAIPDPIKETTWNICDKNEMVLVFRSDTNAYLSHTGRYISTDDGTTAETYWIHPLQEDATLISNPLSISSETLNKIVKISQYNEYWFLATNHIYAIKDLQTTNQDVLGNYIWDQESSDSSRKWNTSIQGVPTSITQSNTFDSTNPLSGAAGFIAGSLYGFWVTKDVAQTWSRVSKQFASNPSPTIYDAISGIQIMPQGVWTVDENAQGFTFIDAQNPWLNLVYEKDYKDYYVDPWKSTADVIVYENDSTAKTIYTLTPILGKISFDTYRKPENTITITIIRMGAFISNAGNNPHQELDKTLVVQDAPVTTLAQAFKSTDTVIIVKNKEKIPSTTQYIELRDTSKSERLQVRVDSNGDLILSGPRKAPVADFPAPDSTGVYLISIQAMLGIEDKISIMRSNQPYDLNSLVASNSVQLSIAIKKQFAELDSKLTSISPIADYTNDNGLKNSLIANYPNDIDPTVSSATAYIGVTPSLDDNATQPHAIYSIYGENANGAGMMVGTDKGIWSYDTNGQWVKESDLGGASKVYFIKQISGLTTAATDIGVWIKNNGIWEANPTYPQCTFDYISSGWFGGNCEVWGKNDGIAFVEIQDSGFISDSFNALEDKNVYGLFKGQYTVLTTDSNGDIQENKYDAMYLCTEIGLYAVTNGTPSGMYNSFLAGREMFGGSPLVKNDFPVKIYKIFQADRPKSVPIIILTNNGVYTVRNWRWGNPLMATSSRTSDSSDDSETSETDSNLDFNVEAHLLDGIPCYSYVKCSTTDSNDVTVYKIFVGTNKGVYRSYSDGYGWERCERINNSDVTVFDLRTYNVSVNGISTNCVVAATDQGIFTSIDDGDTWLSPGNENVGATYSSSISSGIKFNATSLTQSFVLPYDTTANKASFYINKYNNENSNTSLHISVYDDNNDSPGNIIGTCLVQDDISGI